MKKITYALVCIMALFAKYGHAQLTDGSTAPDFTFTDMNGVSQNLYSYLNQGKYVALDISATWCPPCWEYHTKIKTMENMYEKHDAPGDKKWKVLFIEGDETTNDACMKNISGCSSTTKGNWVSGTQYPMCNPPGGATLTKFTKDFKVGFFPMLYLICPNKKVYTKVLNDANAPWPTVADWEAVSKSCGAVDVNELSLDNNINVYPNPSTGDVFVNMGTIDFSSVNIKVVNLLGEVVSETNSKASGSNELKLNLSAHPNGLYFIQLKTDNGMIVKNVMLNK